MPSVARRLIDDSYREFVKPRCAWCHRRFTPKSETQQYHHPRCALAAMKARGKA